MRVLHLLCDRTPGGAERLVLAIAARNGDDVAVLHDTGELAGAFHVLGRTRGRLGVRASRKLVTLLQDYDVLHAHLGAGVIWGVPAARLAGRPVVASWHGREREGRLRTGLRRFWLRRADRVLAVSRSVADDLAAEGITARVVPNGIDLSRFGADWVGGDGILALGRLSPEKGFDVLAAALAPGVPALLGGPPGSVPPPAGLTWLGEIDDVPARMARADVVVIPSRTEGSSLVAMEAMAAGVPVIASQVGGLPEVLGDAARWVPPGDPAALRAALAVILGDAALQRTLSDAGRVRAQRFDLARTADAWATAAREVAGPARRR